MGTLEEILETAGTGEQPMLRRNLQDSLRCYLLTLIPQLKDRPSSFFRALLNHVEVVEYSAKATVFSKGNPYGAIYVLERGGLVEFEGEAETPQQRFELEGCGKPVSTRCFGGDGVTGT